MQRTDSGSQADPAERGSNALELYIITDAIMAST